MNTKVFLNMAFTGLHQGTTLISVGLVSEDGKKFYAELTDYDKSQINPYIQSNTIDQLTLDEMEHGNCEYNPDNCCYIGDKFGLELLLSKWLNQFDSLEIISDYLPYNWVLFCEIFGGASSIPTNISYIPIDICSIFYTKGIDPDIDREEFIGLEKSSQKHNSLWDAVVIKECFDKLQCL